MLPKSLVISKRGTGKVAIWDRNSHKVYYDNSDRVTVQMSGLYSMRVQDLLVHGRERDIESWNSGGHKAAAMEWLTENINKLDEVWDGTYCRDSPNIGSK